VAWDRPIGIRLRPIPTRGCGARSRFNGSAITAWRGEHLGAVRVRPTGGVYFVHRKHTPVLSGLRDLVARFGPESHLSRVPLPDQAEMREMIAAAYSTRAKDELDKLAADIAAAHRSSPTDVAKLHRRFKALQEATAEQTDLLSTALDDTNAALQLVSLQLRSLLITSTAQDEHDA
jgi:hypothetical protein